MKQRLTAATSFPSSIDLPTDGSAHVDLTLTCNATHLLYSANIVHDRLQYYYSYFLHIDCFDANGSQVSYPHFHIYNVELTTPLNVS